MIKLVIITGLSGSGKSTAKKCLEDFGYYTIDNLPVQLIEDFLRLTLTRNEELRNFGLVIDARVGGSLSELPITILHLKNIGYQVELVYLEASSESLARRYSETRRRHPLSPDHSPATGIDIEKKLLKDIRAASDVIIDTSELNIHELKEKMRERFQNKAPQGRLIIRLTSFGFRHGLPKDADLVFDLRFIPNPFFVDELRELTGLDERVQNYVVDTKVGKEFLKKLESMLDYLVPLYQKEGKSYLNIALGCTGGKHRSVTFAHLLGKHYEKTHHVVIVDRDISKTS